MSFYLSPNGWTAYTEAKNLARAQYDFDGFVVVHDEPLLTRAAYPPRSGLNHPLHNADPPVHLTPITRDLAVAQKWFTQFEGAGLDGVVAKRANEPYHSGDRDAMVKIKRLRTADCVVGGFRYGEGSKQIGSLLLGLFNDDGQLDHVGFSSSFTAAERTALKKVVEPLAGGKGFSGKAPGGPSRWSTKRSTEWVPLEPTLVCEVRYDHFSGGRFRHGTKFLRWRPDKKPKQCTFAQLGR